MPTPRRLSTALLLGAAALSAASLAVPALITTTTGGRAAVSSAAGGHDHASASADASPTGAPLHVASPHIVHRGAAAPTSASQLLAGSTDARHSSPETTGPDTITTVTKDAAATATFQVTYIGFTPEARADFQRAIDIWSRLVSSPVPITVSAHYEPLAAGIGGYAGTTSYKTDFPGAKQQHTFYPEALANKMAGYRIDSIPDINGHFNSTADGIHFGTSPIAPGQVDFTSIVLHEIGHGLGFVGAAHVQDGAGSMGTPGYPLAFDRYTRAQDGRSLLNITDAADLATQLQSGTVYFDSPVVRNAFGGQPARLFAPSTWTSSSYSHLDEDSYPQGNANALMTPVLQRGEVDGSPGPLTLAILRTMGW